MTSIAAPVINEQFYKTLMDSMFDAVYTVDAGGVITYWNASCTRLTGYTAAEMVGQNYFETAFAFVDEHDRSPASQRAGIRIVLDTGMPGTWKGYVRRRNGQRLPIESHISPIIDEQGQMAGAVEVFRDISSQVALENAHTQVLQMSRRDQLTGLYNRAAIGELLKAEVERSRRYDQHFSVVMCDVDHFKRVNDQYGHDAGDKVLAAIGGILAHNLRRPDAAGRWGGEEFMVMAPGSDVRAAAVLAERLRRYISEVAIPEAPLEISASFGAAQLTPEQTRDDLIRAADKALYRAKESGRNRVVTATAP